MDPEPRVKCGFCQGTQTKESRFPLGKDGKVAVIFWCFKCGNMIWAFCEESIKVEVKIKAAS